MHPENIEFILVTLDVSQFDMSGKEIKEEHPEKMWVKFVKEF
jgi:hypothetical protein